MNWKSGFAEGKEIVLSTCSRTCEPNANVAISLGFVNGKLLIADCQMKTTVKNLNENKNACVIGGYYRLKGPARIFSSGKYFDLCVKKSTYAVKNAIVIAIKEVFDMDKTEKIL